MSYQKISYWLTTAFLCGIMLYSAQMYFFNTEMVRGYFENVMYPPYIVIPLAIAKIMGVIMILWRGSPWLTEWAYAGFFFDLILATAVHYHVGDGIFGLSLVGLIVLFPSYFLGKPIRD